MQLTIKKLAIIQQLLLMYLLYEYYRNNDKQKAEVKVDENKPWNKSINEISAYKFQDIYSIYIQDLRKKRVRLLEVENGCGSSALWRDLLPNLRSVYLEFNEICAEGMSPKADWLIYGNQNQLKPNKMVATLGPYDVIVDHGGRMPRQQISSLLTLWPTLRNNGIYAIENNPPKTSYVDNSMRELMTNLIVSLQNPSHSFTSISNNETISRIIFSISNSISSVNCYPNLCLLTKKRINYNLMNKKI